MSLRQEFDRERSNRKSEAEATWKQLAVLRRRIDDIEAKLADKPKCCKEEPKPTPAPYTSIQLRDVPVGRAFLWDPFKDKPMIYVKISESELGLTNARGVGCEDRHFYWNHEMCTLLPEGVGK